MADTMTVGYGDAANWYVPPRSAQDYCREMWFFLNNSPDAWCQGVAAKTGSGCQCPPTSPHARAWCLLGLIERFVSGHDAMRERIANLLMRAISPAEWMPVHVFNDENGRTVAQVIALLDTASKLPGDGVTTHQEYKAKTAAYQAAQLSWQHLGPLNDASIKSFEAEMKASMEKLIPWPSIMKQIERQAA